MEQIHRKLNTDEKEMRTNKPFSATVIAFLLLFAITNVMAQTQFEGSLKNVSITDAAGTNTPPTASFTYIQNTADFTFDASGSQDADGNITEFRWDFGDNTKAEGATVNHTMAADNLPVTLTVVDNMGGVALAQKIVTFATAFSVAVNFQPATATIPAGFLVDSGGAFNPTVGYGWTQPPASSGTRDRNSSLSQDQSYDTFIHIAPTAIWEHAVGNGNYLVTVTVGDPVAPDTIQGVQVEGVALIDGERLTTSTRWITKNITANVTDEKLTLTFAKSTVCKLCWVKIEKK